MSLSCQDRRFLIGVAPRRVATLLVLASLAVCSGCRTSGGRAEWHAVKAPYDRVTEVPTRESKTKRTCHNPSSADALLKRAIELEAVLDSACVDVYFAAVGCHWAEIESLGPRPAKSDLLVASAAYNESLSRLLVAAQKHHRLQPGESLLVYEDGRPITIPCAHHGFAWCPDDFNEIEPVGEYKLSGSARTIRTPGLGVPLVVRRVREEDEQFFRRRQPFAATAVLRPCRDLGCPPACDDDGAVVVAEEQDLVLEFYNPAHLEELGGTTGHWPLASDLTAPFAWLLTHGENRPIGEFLRPDAENSRAQLVLLEPYQQGKTPVVFVHGLASDPTTWIALGNELRAEKWFRDRYQIWAFRYPSGMPFLATAATLRRELNAALATFPCAATDPATQQMVVVGHSMGGLIAKLLITESGTDIWDAVANVPLDGIHADPAERERLREVFFFTPQPFVKRVIFIGTPHQGSSLASRGVGRVSSWLVRPSGEVNQRHRELVADNPGVFLPSIRRRVPSSVDLLEPGNPLLVTMERLSVPRCVKRHSIIGVAEAFEHKGPGDGVVKLASASQPGYESEKLIDERHEDLHHAATTVDEINRILEEHLRQVDAAQRACRRAAAVPFDPFED